MSASPKPRAPYLTANEVNADPTILRQGTAERQKQRNRSGQRGGISKMRFEGPFAGRTIAMLESPAYRVLSLSAHRIMARLEIELHRHGGKPEENGQLPCRYEDFTAYGVSRNEIAPAIRELVALGFIQVTRQGSAGNAEHRQAALYLLTYYWTGSDVRVVDGWKRIQTDEEAEAVAKAARGRKTVNSRAREFGIKGATARWKNKSPVMDSIPTPVMDSILKVGPKRSKRIKSPVMDSIPHLEFRGEGLMSSGKLQWSPHMIWPIEGSYLLSGHGRVEMFTKPRHVVRDFRVFQ
jgi:hypothetical protein